MNLHHANDVASRLDAFRNGAYAQLPSNIEIRELVGFLRSVVPEGQFDSSLVSAVHAQPLRFDASLADRIRSQLNIASVIVESNPKLRQKLLRTGVTRSSPRPQGSETFVVLSTLLSGLVVVASLWRFGGYWHWAAILVAALIPVAVIAAIRERPENSGTYPPDSFEFSDPSCDATASYDFGGGGGD